MLRLPLGGVVCILSCLVSFVTLTLTVNANDSTSAGLQCCFNKTTITFRDFKNQCVFVWS